jgi:hypothetical protein
MGSEIRLVSSPKIGCPRRRRYFAFARFSTITGEAFLNPSFEIEGRNQHPVAFASAPGRLFGYRPKEGIDCLSCVAPQNPTYAPW